MADKSVSELIAAQSVTPTDLFVLEQNGTAKKLTGQILENWLVSFADGHGGIQNIEKVSTSGLVDTYRITLADTTTFDFVVNNGRGINTIEKTGTEGLVDTYTIQFNDGTSSTFIVTNGNKGDKGDNTYTWIKYASQKPTETSHSFGDVADNWIGIYSGSSDTAPTDWKQYEWFKIKGEKGDTGDPATLVSATVTYQVGDTGTIIPSGAWSASVPVVAQGKYLWTRTTNTFNTGSPVVSYSVSRMGLDGSGSVSSVANISPDENGNVPLTASDVGALPNTGGDLTGELRMSGQPIKGLSEPTENDHAANMGFVNQQVKKAAPRNLLDNSDFRNPVNQRGLTSHTGTGYTIDRWRSLSISSLVKLFDGYVQLGNTATNGTDLAFYAQYLEVPDILIGKKVTACLTLKDGRKNITVAQIGVNASSTVFTADDKHVGFLRVDWEDSKKCVSVRPVVSTDCVLDVVHISLYEGEYTIDTLPEYQSKGYGVELVECQRYYQIRSTNNISAVDMRPLMRLENPTITEISNGYAYSADL